MKLSKRFHEMKQFDEDSFDFSSEQEKVMRTSEWMEVIGQT